MFKHYIKIGLRNLFKRKGYSLINIFGLSVGLTSIYFIFLFVQSETGYDRHHSEYESLYRVTTQLTINGEPTELATSPPGLTSRMLKDLPEVKEATRILGFLGVKKNILIVDDQKISETGGYLADPNFFEVLNFPFLYGDINTALDAPQSIVLSESLYKKIFKAGNPVNSSIRISNSNGEFDYKITGVFRDQMFKSHLQPKFIASMNSGSIGKFAWNNDRVVGNNFMYSYVRLLKDTDVNILSKKIPDFLSAYVDNVKHGHGFQSVADIYLHPVSSGEFGLTGNIKYLYILITISMLILIIACINFTNMATAQATRRAEEIGVRKAFGAFKGTIVRQFLSESLLITGIAMLLSIIAIYFLSPSFSAVTGKNISIGDFLKALPFLGIIGICIGLLAGSYPAFYLSSLRGGNVFIGKKGARQSGRIRKVLVVMQVSISAALLIGTLTILGQMKFINEKSLGFEKSRRLVVPLQEDRAIIQFEAIKNRFTTVPGVISIAGTSYSPAESVLSNNQYFTDKLTMDDEVGTSISQNDIDYGLIETLKLEVISGRTFNKDLSAADGESVILNETAVKALGVTNEDIIGTQIYTVDDSLVEMTVIGVVRDFHNQSLHQPIDPYLFAMRPGRGVSSLILELGEDANVELLSNLKNIWSEFFPDFPFEYEFLSDQLAAQYETDKRFGEFINFFTMVALVLCCFGLFALTSYTVQQMSKEIGIRKVLGASTFRVYYKVSYRFMLLILAGFAFAIPIGVMAMQRWLASYAYSIELDFSIIFYSFLICLFTALIVISFKIFSAARTNPAVVLRNDS